MPAYRAVFFDAGDTLIHKWVLKPERFAWMCRQAEIALPVDPARVRAGAVAQERYFQEAPPRADGGGSTDWFMGLHRAGLAAAGVTGDLDGLARRLCQANAAHPATWVADPAAPALLAGLRAQGCRLAVVSNWDGTLLETLRPTGLLGYFDAVLDSAVVGSLKPAPGIFHLACAVTGVPPEAAVHVGDAPLTDVAGALAAGLRPVLLDALGVFRAGVPGMPACIRIHRLADLPAVLAGGLLATGPAGLD